MDVWIVLLNLRVVGVNLSIRLKKKMRERATIRHLVKEWKLVWLGDDLFIYHDDPESIFEPEEFREAIRIA